MQQAVGHAETKSVVPMHVSNNFWLIGAEVQILLESGLISFARPNYCIWFLHPFSHPRMNEDLLQDFHTLKF